MIRVLLVEDDEVFRLGLSVALRHHETIALVGTCLDGKMAIDAADSLKPDLILMDIGLPVLSGIEATQAIKSRYPDMKILVLTSHAEAATVDRIMNAGADGYCLKGISTDRLHTLIEEVYQGAFWVDSAVAGPIKQYLQTKSQNESALPSSVIPLEALAVLTEREREVLALIATGKKNNDIAEILSISPGTVRVHVHSILHKLNVKDRTQAALFVMQKQNKP
jgi:two-component system NarL family response regulator